MENRYRLFKGAGVKNITLYNEKATKKMPYIVCVIDEYADLKDMFKEVETHLGRLGQKARASGIHLVIATQRPSADILSSRIKAVIPSAISFNLKNNKDYMTVFGKGINNLTLLGQGDGVMKIEGQAKEFQRFQSPILAPNESEEPEVYQRIKDYLSSGVVEKESLSVKESQEEEPNELYRLKQIIAETRETRVEPLRKELGIKNTRMKDLMTQLVKEGWLVKHPDKTRGYELVASNDVLSEWKN
jgi:S-DNA-T family DNA segregation ATPase FtsK/SpoIIIE